MFAQLGYWICIPFSALLRLFYNLTHSYGVSLILFTLVIKLILLPFQMKSKKSMVRMNRMSGKMQELQKKYANNPAKQQQEMQKLYQEEGITPMSGCLWSFLPIPILIALYYIIREPIVYFMNFGGREAGQGVLAAAKTLLENSGVTLSGNALYEQIEISKIINTSFPSFAAQHPGWINVDYQFLGVDLTAIPTSVISAVKANGLSWAVIGLVLIPILAGVANFLLSKVSMMGQPKVEGGAGMTSKAMLYMMPLISLYMAFILPAALGIYWIAQSAFSMVQEWILGNFYMKKIQKEEDEKEAARQAERKKKQEAAKLLQEQRNQQNEVKQSLKDKQKAAQAAKEQKAKKAASSTTEAGRIADRPYARGRSFKEDRYDGEE